MSSTSETQPAWLTRHLRDTSPPPKLYAWTTANLEAAAPEASPLQKPHQGASIGDLERRVFILGIGNIGRLYAAQIALHPATRRPPITLVVHRKQLLSEWASGKGIELNPPGSNPGAVPAGIKEPFDVEWWTKEPPTCGPVREVADGSSLRSLIITTKASVAIPEVDRLRRYLDDSSAVAFAQNGVCKLWPPYGQTYTAHRHPHGRSPSFLACVTSHGVYSIGPFRSVHAALGDVIVGPVPVNVDGVPQTTSSSSTYLTQCIADAPGLHGKAVSSAELWILQLEKLVYNSSINPLTAILRCKNGGLFEEPNGIIARVMDRLLEETSRVLQALVVHESSALILDEPSALAGKSADAAHEQRAQLVARFAQPRLRQALHAFGAKVAANTSSMLQDVQAGKPTEIRDFNGWLIETAAFLDPTIDMTAHRSVVEMVESNVILTKEELGRRILG
ncbi:hypothetical protein HIM_09672 [Hirsutella minnesotensis 3608]|uniref:Ketopantoate reductase C-terminal domain-containing protein n=1 Tax=Hirsutella minnesotensis 3608 TaxID=1043627 RepID=A0A0F7ZGH9_9HYPO|nr:hypothetical protein HIM_09672 [Hirsutella minnesotensis 3608]